MIKSYTKCLSALLLLFSFSMSFAQDGRTIEGTVKDPDGIPLMGANVIIKNSEPPRGTTTDFDGNFTLDVQPGDEFIMVKYLGFADKEVALAGKDKFDISLEASNQLDEVVVTALDMERSEKSLGYSVQKIGSRDISDVKVGNISNKLAGRVSGVFVNSSGNGPTGSANVTIRGQTSLTGNSQPLYVVNGMPISNGLFSPGDGLNGSTTIDFGNASQVVNPDDVESMSILKGPAAAAIYGSRAANGVILLTTKKGDTGDDWNFEWNLQTMGRETLVEPNFQNTYGFGGYGFYSYKSGDIYTAQNGINYYDAFGENWGPRMDGQNIKQFNSNGEAVPFTPAPDNFDDFYRTGVLTSNNIAVSNNSENGDFRLSYTFLDDQSIVPNSGVRRHTVYTSVGREFLDDKLKIRANIFNIRNKSDNIPNGGYDESNSVQYGWLWYPRQVGVNELKDYWRDGQEGSQQRYVEELWVNNPWFVVNENTNSFQENRAIGNVKVNYEITDKLSVRTRYGVDYKRESRQFRRATSTKAIPGQFGSYREDEISFQETNAELLFTYTNNDDREADFKYDFKLGGNMMRQASKTLVANNSQLLIPDQFTLTNSRTDVQVESRRAEKKINSIFGMANLSYDDWIFLDLTARNDWSSTLPTNENSYFYPSATLSGVISDQLELGADSPLTFLKLRAAYAEVGSDTDPFLLTNTYQAEPLFGSNPALSNNSFAANPNLKPERTQSYELGLDARFFENDLKLDFTYYDMLSQDQIIFLPVPTSSGKETRLVNAGEIASSGIELSLDYRVVETDDFSWNTIVNIGANEAIVESLPDGVEDSYPIVSDVFPTDGGSQDLELVAIEGEKLGQLRGLGFQRNGNGQIIHENGIPQLTDEKVTAGSYQPDARFGWQNIFNYKNWQLSVLFDGQVGGRLYSRGHALFNTGGTITNEDDPILNLTTLEGRAEYNISYDANGDPVYSLRPGTGQGVVGPGVKADGQGGFVANDEAVAPRDYFYAYYGNGFNRDNIEAATYDNDWVKLRELRLTYDFPTEWFGDLGIDSFKASIIGRNLLLITDVPTVDPETFSIRGGNFVNGFGSNPLPSTSSLGISLNARL
jgi:TonB-linked SusC/RagA family outer membrane protein